MGKKRWKVGEKWKSVGDDICIEKLVGENSVLK